MNKKNNIAIFLGVILFFSFMRISELSRKVDDLKYELNDIKYKVEDMDNKTIENEKSNNLVSDSDFKIKEIDNNKFTTNVKVNIELNRLSQNSYPVFLYRETGLNKWNEIELVNEGGLVYSCNIDLNQDKYYEYKVFTQGEVQESSEVQEISEWDYTGSLSSWSIESTSNGGYYITLFDPYSREGIKRDEFLVEEFYVEVKADSGTDKYEFKKDRNSNKYELDLKQKYLTENKYKIYLVVKYKNGLEKRHDID